MQEREVKRQRREGGERKWGGEEGRWDYCMTEWGSVFDTFPVFFPLSLFSPKSRKKLPSPYFFFTHHSHTHSYLKTHTVTNKKSALSVEFAPSVGPHTNTHRVVWLKGQLCRHSGSVHSIHFNASLLRPKHLLTVCQFQPDVLPVTHTCSN